jgi:hypothetical protein
MPFVLVPSDIAERIIRPEGSDVTVINQSTIDVYMDAEAGRLNASAPGSTPNGTRIAANGGEHRIRHWPCKGMWVRAAATTTIEVEP